ELQEPGEFLTTLKVDLTPNEVYAFTPKGRVLELPAGATPVDFAYAVHTEVGHQCVGAKVNGQMVALRHEISSGDVVEILTQKGHGPSRDWLSFVKSSGAKSKIRHWINVREREEATDMGRRLLEKESRAFGRALKKIEEAELQKAAADYGLSKVEDLFAAVGFGKYSARQVLTKVLGEGVKPDEPADDTKPTLVKTVKRMLGIGEAPWSSRATTTCWSSAPNAVTPSRAMRSSDTSRAAAESRYTPVPAPACRIFSTSPNAALRSSGAARARPPSRSSSRFAPRIAPVSWLRSPRSSAAPVPTFVIWKAARIARMPASRPASRSSTGASLKAS